MSHSDGERPNKGEPQLTAVQLDSIDQYLVIVFAFRQLASCESMSLFGRAASEDSRPGRHWFGVPLHAGFPDSVNLSDVQRRIRAMNGFSEWIVHNLSLRTTGFE